MSNRYKKVWNWSTQSPNTRCKPKGWMSQTKYRSLAYPDCIQMHFRKSGQQKTTWNIIFFLQTGAGPQGGERNRSFLPQSYGQTLHYILARLLWSAVETICRPVTPRPLRSLILVKVLLCSGFKVLEAAHPMRRLTNIELPSLFSAPIPVAYKGTSCLTHNKFYLAELKATLCCHFALTMCSSQDSRRGKVRNSERRTQSRAQSQPYMSFGFIAFLFPSLCKFLLRALSSS